MSDAAEPVLELRDVSVEYPGGIRAIDGIQLRVFPHDLLGLLGPNGAGKSTLLAVILGLQKPTRGSVRLFGRPVSPEGLRRLGYVPQRPQSTYPDFPATVLEAVLVGRAARARPFRGVTRRERKEAEEILTLLDIHGLRDRRIGRLSGGQTQRVFVAKALVGKPELLVLDEPTSGMDAQSRREFYLMLVHLNRDLGITIVLTSHEVHSVTKLASRIAFLSGILLYELGRGFGISLESLLFGSILLASTNQFLFVAAVLAAVLALMLFSFSKLVYTTFNETQAQAAGIRTAFFDYMLSALAGVAVIISIPIAGILLIAALLVLPGLTSIQVARSFRETMVLSPVFGLASVVVGLLASLVLDVAPGATIVLSGLGILLAVVTARKIGEFASRE